MSSAKPCKRKSQRRTGDFPPGAVQSFLFRVPYGSRPGSGLKSQKHTQTIRWGIKEKVPDFIRNQELFGGDCWTRTSDLLRVKIRQGRRGRPIPPVSSRLPLFDRRRWQISSHTLRCLRPRFFCSGSGSGSLLHRRRFQHTARQARISKIASLKQRIHRRLKLPPLGASQETKIFSQADLRVGISWFRVSHTEGTSMAPYAWT